MFDSWQSVVALVVSVLIAYAVILWLGIIVWVVRDIRERTRDSWVQTVSVVLVGLFNIPGLILYLILRPNETLADAYERRLEAEALRDMPGEGTPCPTCSRPMQADFLLCPYCRTRLREPCSGCGRALDRGWTVCPHCGAEGPQAGATSSGPFAQPAPAPSSPPRPEQAPSSQPPAETGKSRAGSST